MTQKVAVIPGSHKGSGYAIARQLAQQENIQVDFHALDITIYISLWNEVSR
jgi:NAD(P)-dependent dehydrogenase (short-subunit alcohol dehydrogenase family)